MTNKKQTSMFSINNIHAMMVFLADLELDAAMIFPMKDRAGFLLDNKEDFSLHTWDHFMNDSMGGVSINCLPTE